MGMKFLNKKGWHTGSLRNIENVWKAEQKHDVEQKKLEELRKQIIEERERSEFRLLQEQAGLIPKQERLDFLYDSGLSVGKGSSEGFKDLQSYPQKKPETEIANAAPSSAVPGALFEDKPQSANDAWRKLHSDPLLMIRQREQEALARVRNNPVQMAIIHKSIEAKKHKNTGDKKERKKHRDRSSKHQRHLSPSKELSDSENVTLEKKGKRKGSNHSKGKFDDHFSKTRPDSEEETGGRTSRRKGKSPSIELSDSENDTREKKGKRKGSNHNRAKFDDHNGKIRLDSEEESGGRGSRRKTNRDDDRKYKVRPSSDMSDPESTKGSNHNRAKFDDHNSKIRLDSEEESGGRGSRRKTNRDDDQKYKVRPSSDISDPETARFDSQHKGRNFERSRHDKYSVDGRTNSTASRHYKASLSNHSPAAVGSESQYRRRNTAPKITEEERAARLRAMQEDAELHEEQRWKRLKKADEDDAREATQAGKSGGKNFLVAAQTSVYGAEKGGSSTIEESVRRRAHYSQGRSEANAGNAFRR